MKSLLRFGWALTSFVFVAAVSVSSNLFAQAPSPASPSTPSPNPANARARLVITGDLRAIGIGQDGICGVMDQVTTEQFQRLTVPAAKRTWLRVVHSSGGDSCIADGSFIPEANQAYIVRFSNLKDACLMELFKIVPGADPAQVPLQAESAKSCAT